MVYRPTDRERQRYVRYAGINPLKTFEALFGIMGLAVAGLQSRGDSVLRVNATHVDHVKAAIALTAGCRSVSVKSNITKAKQ